jgi:ABC-type multidrug transport system permease subunit
MFSFKRVIAVAKREYLELRRNTLYVYMAFLSPLILFVPFAYGLNLDTNNVMLGICDMDNTPVSRDFINMFQTTGGYFIVKEYRNTYDTMDDKVQSGELEAVIVIPEHFSKDLKNCEKVDVQLITNALYSGRAETILNYIESGVAEFNTKLQNKYLLSYGKQLPVPIKVYQAVWFNETLESNNFMIPPIIPVLLYFLPPLISSLCIVKEKEIGSIMAFYCSPITKAEYIIGKMIPYIVIAYVDFIILFTAARLLFMDVPFRGSLFNLLVVAFIYSIATTGVGLLLSVSLESQVATVMVCFVGTMIPAFGFSDAFDAVSTKGAGAQMFSKTLAVSYAVKIIKDIFLKVGSWELYWQSALMLVVFAIVLPTLAIIIFKKKM